MDNPEESTTLVDLIITFRGIAAPTAKIQGNDACAMTFRQIVDGQEPESDEVLFAYQEGITWKTCLPAVAPGQYRLTLISSHLHCSLDVIIDEDVLTQRVLRVEFNRDNCRRKLIPVFIKRLWWNLLECLRKRKDHPRRDQHALSQYRSRFRRGPFGRWLSSHDRLTIYGCSIEFRKDFTGTIRTWGYEDEDESETQRDFRWQCVGDWRIDVQPVDGEAHAEDWGILEYDFRVSRNPYGTREVLMYAKNGHAVDSEEPGFWWSYHPVTLVENRRR